MTNLDSEVLSSALIFCVAFVMTVSLKFPGGRDSLDYSFFKKLSILNYRFFYQPRGGLLSFPVWVLKQEALLISFLGRIRITKGFLVSLALCVIAHLSLHCWPHSLFYFCFILVADGARIIRHYLILVFIMWFSLFEFWGSITLSCYHFWSLFVGFYPPFHIVLLSSPLLSFPFRKMEKWLHYFWFCQVFCHKVGTTSASDASGRVVTALNAVPAPRCNAEHWDSRGSTLLPGWFSQKHPGKPQERKLQSKQNQLGIMTIHPSHAFQHGSSWGLQNDAFPAWAGSQVMMSLKFLWPVTQELM